MSQLTLRLPKTLHQQLTGLAKSEGISLNQYIVYALTRQVALAYSIQPMSEEALVHQGQAFSVLLHKLGEASPTEIESVLAEREMVAPESELSSGIITHIQQRINESTKI